MAVEGVGLDEAFPDFHRGTNRQETLGDRP
jgi:hypothetical protein